MTLFQPAVKERLKARIAIDGPTGAGKTWTALQYAAILARSGTPEAGPIGHIDTENRSAAYYAMTPAQIAGTETVERLHPWDAPYAFGHMPWPKPYDPRRLTEIVNTAGEELGPTGVLVIDSLSHFWFGEGGTLELVDNVADRSFGGNRFAGWKEGTPAQRGLLDAIVHAPCHVIVTMRSKMEYVMDQTDDGNGRNRTTPRKVGLKPVQRDDVEYEFTVVADMDLEHRLMVGKSRCSLVADMVLPAGRSAELALTLRDWLDTGVERVSKAQASAIVAMVAKVDDEQAKDAIKSEFTKTFGPVANLTTEQYATASEWMAAQVATWLAGGVTDGVVPDGVPVQSALADALSTDDEIGGE